jgi:hypothetical protein
MTLYAELLKLALVQPPESPPSLDAAACDAATRRQFLGRADDAASRLAAELSYDLALAELCRQLGIDHDLAGEKAGPVARRGVERRLVTTLPTLGAVLE